MSYSACLSNRSVRSRIDVHGRQGILQDAHWIPVLNLTVLGLSPTVLAEFARAVPHLRSLTLNRRFICPYRDQGCLLEDFTT